MNSGGNAVTGLVELFIAGSAIDFIEAQDADVQINAGGRGYRVRRSMAEVGRQLDRRRFVRIGTSYILNIASIARLEHDSHGCHALLLDGSCIPMSVRSYRKLLIVLSRNARHECVQID